MARSKKGRSRKGTGSLYQRPDGRWVGAIVIGYHPATGNPIRKKVYGDTREEAEDQLRSLQEKKRAGDDVRGGDTALRFFIDLWLDGRVKPKVDPATYALNKQRIEDFILPYLGKRALAALTPFQVKAWYETLEAKGASAHCRNRAGQLLRRCLDYAVSLRYLRTNVARDLELPRATVEEMHPLDEAQVKQFLAAAATHRLYPLWLLALDTGMRQGEILALEWTSVDLDTGTISVTKSVRTGDGGGARVKEVKTKASRRRIRITARTVAALRAWRRKSRGKLVFPARRDRRAMGKERHILKGGLLRTLWRLLDKAGLPTIRFHDLRHTHATLALLKTKNAKAVSSRLGHADIRVTLNTYAHYLPVMEDELVAAMEEVLAPVKNMPHNLPQNGLLEKTYTE
jgi:integrase